MNEQSVIMTWNGETLPNGQVHIERCLRRQSAFGVAYCEIVLSGNLDDLRALQLTGQEITVTLENQLDFQGTVVASTRLLSQLGSSSPTRTIVAIDTLAILCHHAQPRVFHGESIEKVMQMLLDPLSLFANDVAAVSPVRLPQFVQLTETHGELLAWLLDITSTWIMLDNDKNVNWRTWLPSSTQAYSLDNLQTGGLIVWHEETPTKEADIFATGYDHQQGQAQTSQLATDSMAASQLTLSTMGNVDINLLAELRRSRQQAWEKGLSGLLRGFETQLYCGQVVATDDGPRYLIDSLHAWQSGYRGYTLFSTVPGGIHWLLQQYRHLDWVGDWLVESIQTQWPRYAQPSLTLLPQELKSANSILLGTVKAYHPQVEKIGLTDAVEITLPVGDQAVEIFARQTHSFLFPNGSGGLHAPPQAGTEVAIRFLDQQPLIPVVVGYLANHRHPSPAVEASLQPIVLQTGANQLILSQASEGVIELTADSEIALQSGNTQLKLSHQHSDTAILQAAGETTLIAGKTLDLKGQTIVLGQTTTPPNISTDTTANSANSLGGDATVLASSTAISNLTTAAEQSQSAAQSPSGNLLKAFWEYAGGAALCGESVKLVANTKEADGETVDFKIYCVGINGGTDTEEKTLSATVANDKAEVEWIYEDDDEDESELPECPPKRGESFAVQHYFKAMLGNNNLESPRLTWKTSLCLSIEDEQERRYPQMHYHLIDAAGVQHEGTSDSEGCINIDDLAAGPWWIEFKPADPSNNESTDNESNGIV